MFKMKKILPALVLCAVSITCSATTLIPVQTLNPAGSVSGQTIVSAGSSATPVWGSIGVSGIAAIAANTVIANATGSSASPTAFAMPSCSTTSSALNWTSGSGFGCNTAVNATTLGGVAAASYALLASPSLTGTPTAPTAAVGTNTTQIATTAFVSSSPTINTPTINGVTNGSSAPAGAVGELLSATTTGTSITANTPANATSKLLSAGDWNVQCTNQFVSAGTTTSTAYWTSVSTTSAALSGSFSSTALLNVPTVTGVTETQVSPIVSINVSSPTTVYCVAQASFGTSTMTVNGSLFARRVH